MADLNFEVCDGKTFRDLCKEVLDRSESKKNQLDTLYSDVRGMIKDKNDAQVFLPKLKEFIDAGVKNDEQLIKLASVIQRLQSTQLETTGGETGGMSEEEREQLILNAQKDRVKEIKEIKKEVEDIVVPKKA